MTNIIDLEERFGVSPALWGPHLNRLWYAGDLSLLELPRVSIVGTRNVTPHGRLRTIKLVSLLVSKGFCIVSGLAAGVDTVAHETTLDANGKTIAVMGTPIETCYPKENQALKDRITEKGLIISQFAPGQKIHRSNFPRRNSLMAALSAVTFVVEAEIDSGTRHQVHAALALGQKVAFLASLADRDFGWVREAIRSGHGVIVQDPTDALDLLSGMHLTKKTPRPSSNPAKGEKASSLTEKDGSVNISQPSLPVLGE